MIRLYIHCPFDMNTEIVLDDNHIHYLFHVMRQKSGDTIHIFNGMDGEWSACIETLTKKEGRLSLIEQIRPQSETNGAVLAVALIKKDGFDFILQKATELGVKKIIPLITKYTVIHQLNMDRANHILVEAAEQCERLDVPVLEHPCPLPDFLNNTHHSIIYLSERGQSSDVIPNDTSPCFVIGPEGGWHPDELALFQKHQATSVNLGRLILRAETAAISILAAHRFQIF